MFPSAQTIGVQGIGSTEAIGQPGVVIAFKRRRNGPIYIADSAENLPGLREKINLTDLAHLDLWVGWREEIRPGRDKPTKVPYDPRTGRKAESDNPATWATRGEAELWAATHNGNGAVLMLGPIGDGRHLGGVDLDTCHDPENGETELWAREVIIRFDCYAEVSPSATGHKVFFLYPLAKL